MLFSTGRGIVELYDPEKHGIWEIHLRDFIAKNIGPIDILAVDEKGVIVAKSLDEKLKYAASIIPEISLFEYELNFKIKEDKF